MHPALRIFCFTSYFSSSLCAQTNKATLTVQFGFPAGEYKEVNPVIPSGLLFGITHQTSDMSPLSVGGEFGILQVNGKTEHYTGYYNNEYNTYVVASWNHVITTAGIVRMELLDPEIPWSLHIDITAGANFFLTTSTVSRDLTGDIITNMPIVKYYYSDTHLSVALRTGGGLGVDVPVGKKKRTAIALKGSYLFGSPATYYTKPKIIGGQIETTAVKSGTSMILAEAGVRFYLVS
jgi:hypothetical protein